MEYKSGASRGLGRVRRCAVLKLALGLLVLCVAGCERAAEARRQPPPPTVGVVVAKQASVPLKADTNGTTRALKEISLRARVRGVLEKILFEEGANVHAGEVLFEIEKKPFENKLAVATARLAEKRAAVQKARDSKAVEIATAQLGVDTAELALARVEENRNRALLARNVASQQDLDQAVAARQKAEAQVESEKRPSSRRRSTMRPICSPRKPKNARPRPTSIRPRST